jgi:hypothetical protein
LPSPRGGWVGGGGWACVKGVVEGVVVKGVVEVVVVVVVVVVVGGGGAGLTGIQGLFCRPLRPSPPTRLWCVVKERAACTSAVKPGSEARLRCALARLYAGASIPPRCPI